MWEDGVHLSRLPVVGDPSTRSKIGLGGLQVLSGLVIYSSKDFMKPLSHHGKGLPQPSVSTIRTTKSVNAC